MNWGTNTLRHAICEIALEVCIGEEIIQRGQHLRPPTCDIASEGIQSDRKSANVIGQGFIKSEEGFIDRRRVFAIERSPIASKGVKQGQKEGFIHRRGVFIHWKGSKCIGRWLKKKNKGSY